MEDDEFEQYKDLPASTVRAIYWYVVDGDPVGDFVRCLLSNDLYGAIGHADNQNRKHLVDLVMLVSNRIPMSACGSRDNFDRWQTHRGFKYLKSWETGTSEEEIKKIIQRNIDRFTRDFTKVTGIDFAAERAGV